MQSEVQDSPRKFGKKAIIVALVIFSALMLLTAVTFSYLTLNKDTVYEGINVNGLDVGGLSQDKVRELLNVTFQDKAETLDIILKTEKVTKKITFTELNVLYDIDSTVNAVWSVGRSGNIFVRLYDVVRAGSSGFALDAPISFSSEGLASFLDSFYQETHKDVKEPDVLIQDDKVVVHSGQHGENVDIKALQVQIEDMIKNCRGGEITVAVVMTMPGKLNVDDLYSQINREPTNASFSMVDGKVEITPHVIGRSIDKAALEIIANELEKTENTERVLPVVITQPAMTLEAVYANLFKDTLATFRSHFSTSNVNDKNRGENIKLAVSKIDGKIFLPGEEFSFNGIVGPRSEETGYKVAHTYVAGKVIDGIGGGICQVSSTLYNAVLKADLEVVERRNHMFTVGYVPYGQDATVSFGSTDFRFKNNTNWPIKLSASVSKTNYVSFTFTGTNEQPDKKVILTQKIVKNIPFTVKYIDDPNMDAGKTSVKQNGKDGMIVDTFKTVKIGDTVISQVKLHTSKYNPLTEEVIRGTKALPQVDGVTVTPLPGPSDIPAGEVTPAPGGASATPAPVEATPDTTTGVDDADNPPAVD